MKISTMPSGFPTSRFDSVYKARLGLAAIRGTASGTQLIQDLLNEGVHSITKYQTGLDKTMHMHSVSNTIENGFVYLPEKAPWLADYEQALKRPSQKRLCLLPALKQLEESLGTECELRRSVGNRRTWQPARCVIPFFPVGGVFEAAALLGSFKGTKSRSPRSTASRYATIFRATASVARLAFPVVAERQRALHSHASAVDGKLYLAELILNCGNWKRITLNKDWREIKK